MSPTGAPVHALGDHEAAGAGLVGDLADEVEAGLLEGAPGRGVVDVGRGAGLGPVGMAGEDDVGDEGADHGRADADAAVGGVGDEVVDAGGGALDAEREPRRGLLGVVGRGVALDPTDVAAVGGGDPELTRVGVGRAVVAHDTVPGDVVALPPTHDAGLVQPAVEHRQVIVDQPTEGHVHRRSLAQFPARVAAVSVRSRPCRWRSGSTRRKVDAPFAGPSSGPGARRTPARTWGWETTSPTTSRST